MALVTRDYVIHSKLYSRSITVHRAQNHWIQLLDVEEIHILGVFFYLINVPTEYVIFCCLKFLVLSLTTNTIEVDFLGLAGRSSRSYKFHADAEVKR